MNCLAALVVLTVVLVNCRAGFDFTDEGFYLNWISDPQRYRASATQFGFVYHPLYELLSGDITTVRRTNVLASFTLAFVLCAIPLSAFNHRRSEGPGGQLAIALIGAACSLAFFELWNPSPSYNSLNFQSTIILAVGMTVVLLDRFRYSIAAWLLVALGISLSFLAKPPTAIVMSILLIGYVIVYEKQKLLALCLFICATAAFMMLSAWMIDGSLGVFARRLLDGAYLLHQLRDRSVWNYLNIWYGFGWSPGQIAAFCVIGFLATALGYLQGPQYRLLNAVIAIGFGAAKSPLGDGGPLGGRGCRGLHAVSDTSHTCWPSRCDKKLSIG